MFNNKKGVSAIIGIIMLLAIVIVTSSTIYVLVNTTKLPEKYPISYSVQASATYSHVTGMGETSQIVEIRHIAGDKVPVEEIKIMVEIYRGNNLLKHTVFWGFPCYPWEIEWSGNDIISRSHHEINQKVFGELGKIGDHSEDGIWEAGEKIGFRIKISGDGLVLQDGDKIDVKIIHIPSNVLIIHKEIYVQ